MKRFPVVLGATVAGLAGVLTFHTRSSTFTQSGGAASATRSGTTTTSAPPTTTTTTTAPGGSTVATPPPPTTTAPSATSATGTAEQYGFGVLSVRVTMRASKITDVTVATLQTAETYSQQLANQVIPVLRREVLATQTARINGITGATYTCEAYAASVQSALDKLHRG